jgi:C4-type Zn-finger protein
MNTKNKEFKYKGYSFNIKIELFSSIERRINGQVLHTLTINDMGASNFYIKKEVLDENIEKEIFELEHKAKAYVDNKSETREIDLRLEKLGFE